ncbi:MAG: peptidase M48, partial [Nitrospirae bacterium]|nr:peptidase M48 [Nitrospirota bacterium]
MKILSNLYRFISSFLILLLLSCAVNPVTGEKEFMLIAEDEEISIGKEIYPNILWGEEGGGGVYRDQELEGYLEGIIKRLHSVSHRPNLPVDFVIQNSSVPNA